MSEESKADLVDCFPELYRAADLLKHTYEGVEVGHETILTFIYAAIEKLNYYHDKYNFHVSEEDSCLSIDEMFAVLKKHAAKSN